jgi:hypothetical protein
MTMNDLYVRHGDSEEIYHHKNDMCMDIWNNGVPDFYRKFEHPWQEYFRQSTFAKRKEVREQYYKSGQWICQRNILLWDNNFVCRGCNGIANQAHHQGWSKKWQNYEHLGNTETEEKSLVPICQNCHEIVTRVQSKKPRPRTR